jgi:hypothetical protein
MLRDSHMPRIRVGCLRKTLPLVAACSWQKQSFVESEMNLSPVNEFGLRALERSKANRNLGREESTPETLACYSTSTLGGALAVSKGS